jgi:bacterioferritin-associated ferredoxin
MSALPNKRAMIVCLCHRVSDRDIRAAVSAGAHCFEAVQDDTRVASGCGRCHDCARQVCQQALMDVAAPSSPAHRAIFLAQHAA